MERVSPKRAWGNQGSEGTNEEGEHVYTQDFDPVSSSLGLSSIFAVLPVMALTMLFILMLQLHSTQKLLLVMLTAFLGPLVVLGAHKAIEKDVKLFHAMILLLQFAMMGAFLAQDLFLFYLFWEAMLIPMFFIIGMWGGARRIYATVKFVLYTAFGSILMLAAMIYLVQSLRNTSGVTGVCWDKNRQQWLVRIGKRSFGRYDCIAHAVMERKARARELFGEFAYEGAA